MSATYNRAQILGRLGRDPEIRFTQSNQSVCTFSVATDEGYTDKSGAKQSATEWHRIVVWGKLAERCGEFLAKGQLVFVEGKLKTRQWEKDGQTQRTTEVVASNVQFVETINRQRGEAQPLPFAAGAAVAPSQYDAGQDGDVPF